MGKFKFRLENVLTQRKRREDSVLASLATAQRALQAEKERKIELNSMLDRSFMRREGLGEQATGIQVFITENDFITGLRQRIIQADQGILRANRGVEKALRAYLFAKRQTRMIEALRERAAAEHKQAEAKREQKNLDEMMIMRHRLKEPSLGGEDEEMELA